MSLAIFPTVRGLAYPVVKAPGFNTLLQGAPNLLETAIAQTYNPAWEWQLVYEFLFDNVAVITAGTWTDYATLQGFILARSSRAEEFLFSDPQDHAVGPATLSGTPNLQAQLQVVNDGAGTYYSPIQRNFGGQFYEDITDLNGSIAVYDNGTLKALGTDYTIVGPGLALPGYSYMGLVIKWGSAPTGPVTAAFNFYFRVRFPSDKQEFTEFMNQLWTLGGSESSSGGALILKSSRPVQV